MSAPCSRPAPLAFYILDVPSLNPPLPPTVAFSSYAPSPPSSRLPLLGITLFAFPAAGRRVVVRYLTRVYSSRSVRAYIDRILGPLSRIPLAPAMHAALHPPCCAHLVSLARDDRIRRITTCVFYEPRRTALAKTNARGFPGCFDCSWGRVRHAWIS